MKIISWNVNGIRAVERKGALAEVLKSENPDILLFQEIKATPEQLSDELVAHPEYAQFYHPAEKKGYAGTAIWIKKNGFGEIRFLTGMPHFVDNEGRISQVQFGDFAILSLYFPNGGKSPEAWEGKLRFYEDLEKYASALRKSGKIVIFGGDINCAHEEIDLARPRENDGVIGFHPEERRRISDWTAKNWADVFRDFFPETITYSWWSPRGGARFRNVGWRIDAFFMDRNFLDRVQKIEYLTEQTGSDHCPVVLEIAV